MASPEQVRYAQAGTAMGVAPADPRLHAINNTICGYADDIRAHTQALNLKADAIVGHVRTGETGKGPETPTPVPNGALEQIEMALASLHSAIEDLAAAERRFGGLA